MYQNLVKDFIQTNMHYENKFTKTFRPTDIFTKF